MNDPDENAGLRHEIKCLRTALDQALALCKGCDGTGTVPIADVETGEQVGAQNCEKCWPIRINSGSVKGAKPMNDPTRCYMDGIDWQHHLGHDRKGTKLYASREALVEGTASWAEKRRQMYLDLEDRNRVRDQAVELIKATRRLENALVLPGGTVLPFPKAVNE